MADDGSAPILVSVVIPTLNRREPLARAVASVVAQAIPDDLAVELVIVDNSCDGNARGWVEGLPSADRISLRYLSVPRPGVATARNAGVAAARGLMIAFLDDDEEAGATWLAELLAVARSTGADAVFGPVRARAEGERDIGVLGRFFARQMDHRSGQDITARAAYLGTNNSLFSRAACRAVAGPFDEALDGIGGEDSLFLKRLVLAGRRFAWAERAVVTEWVPARRLTWAYVKRRRFLSGQIRTFVHRMADPPSWRPVLVWMVVGALQCTLAGVGAALARPFSATAARRLEAVAWGGLGKVFWMSRFRPGLYGDGLVS